ncbi:60S ribosomal protein L36-A [Cyclospora cayetanensis]|uniref:60S ribosomal protein L36 n=2 Tax=Cyclospora cayetanensis TaxID=88456 RepID=A0A1D3D6P7_9EIME|nr:60S ribosomal protein L36-A [Cyclospora cayetanensis]OEH79125.1 60s ribosomal protein [Cyclospora cayetanensis]
MSASTGIRVGLNKGFLVTKRPTPERPSRRKGKRTTRVQAIREIVRQVAGFAPYERRILDLIKVGTAATNKRALKFAKKRLGTHKRGKAKREELTQVAAAMKKKTAA